MCTFLVLNVKLELNAKKVNNMLLEGKWKGYLFKALAYTILMKATMSVK